LGGLINGEHLKKQEASWLFSIYLLKPFPEEYLASLNKTMENKELKKVFKAHEQQMSLIGELIDEPDFNPEEVEERRLEEEQNSKSK